MSSSIVRRYVVPTLVAVTASVAILGTMTVAPAAQAKVTVGAPKGVGRKPLPNTRRWSRSITIRRPVWSTSAGAGLQPASSTTQSRR